MNKEDFVTYEQALVLKKLGFREKCLYFYKDETSLLSNILYGKRHTLEDFYDDFNEYFCSAPTLCEAQAWLRE